ncbi:hypothetical protein IL306_012576 [Fusarium sp. DS 682]|nr:hypothetical protein IL306_012576 [Fusarium sp. DS 682]
MATSGDSALLTPRERFNLVKVSEPVGDGGAEQALIYYVTNQILFDFPRDVSQGTLAARGWCFQERLLATRLLHFGRDQLHWECHEGIWSESSTRRQWYDELGTSDDGELRVSLQSNVVFGWPAGANDSEVLGENATEEGDAKWNNMLAATHRLSPPSPTSSERRKMYDDWYKAVSAYTYRQLTKTSDKLPAIAGAAVRFNRLINDVYAGGIWGGDLPQGLLWSRSAFEAVEVDATVARRPGVGGRGEMSGDENKGWRGAPSWSWASVDGPIHWARHRQGPVHIGPFAVMTKPNGNEAYGGLEWCAVRVQGHLLDSENLSWIRDEARNPDTQSEFEKWLATQPASSRPQIDPDDPEWERTLEAAGRSRPLYSLLVCSIPLGRAQGEKEGGEPRCLLGFALMLRFWPSDGAFRRVGIAKVALRDFMNATRTDIYIM